MTTPNAGENVEKLDHSFTAGGMRRVDSLEKTLMLGGIGGRRRRGQCDLHSWLNGVRHQREGRAGDFFFSFLSHPGDRAGRDLVPSLLLWNMKLRPRGVKQVVLDLSTNHWQNQDSKWFQLPLWASLLSLA